MELIKKVILELWCMSYGVGLFLVAWWKLMSVVAVSTASVLFVAKIIAKDRSRT